MRRPEPAENRPDPYCSSLFSAKLFYMKAVWKELFRAIHEGYWLAVEYHNQKNETTSYWIAVNYKRLKSLASCFTDEFLQSIPFGMNAAESASTGL